MTTMVIVSSPTPNHQKVKVQQGYVDAAGKFVASGPAYVAMLDDGQSTVLHVHDGCSVLVTEEKRTPAEAHG